MRLHVALLACAIFLLGVGNLAVLPPFEGFDEPAHYSSIQQVAYAGEIPKYKHSFLSREVLEYETHGPMPYTSGNPPFTGNGGMTYKEFFAAPALYGYYREAFRTAAPAASYAVSGQENWEAQHPPLYYILMAPLQRATQSMPLVTRLLVLRLASFSLAFCGLLIGLKGSLDWCRDAGVRRYMPDAFLIYPLVVPMFFPEFARLGNDSLCLLLMGIIWAMLLRWLQNETETRLAACIGICFGLGLLTKALFLPVLAGLVLFMALRIWRGRDERKKVMTRLTGLALMLVPALLIGGWYYAGRLMEDGSAIGYEFSTVTRKGGLWRQLMAGRISPVTFLRGAAATLATWSWAGTWSLTRVAEIFRLPVLALTGWLLIGYFREARKYAVTEPAWLPMFLGVPLLGGLLYHVLIMIAATGAGVGSGWYFSIAAPAIAFAFAHGLARIAGLPRARWIFKFLLFYALAFLCLVTWEQMTLFAGCSAKGADKYYAFPDSYACIAQLPIVMRHLDVLGWPTLAALAFGAGIFCAVLGIRGIFYREQSPT